MALAVAAVGRPALADVAASDALTTKGTRLPDQNVVRFQSGDAVVIINEDKPFKSTAYISGGG